jgi:hypothetical protein
MGVTYNLKEGIPMEFKFDDETLKQNEQRQQASDDKQPKEEKKPRAKRTTAEKHSANECTQKIYQLWAFTHRVTNSKLPMLKESDFSEEGAGLSRLSEKHVMIALALKVLDPMFVCVGIYNKFHGFANEGFTRWKDRKQVINMKKKQGANGDVTYEYEREGIRPNSSSIQ